MTTEVDDAEIVIVGGGVIGCAVAYHLARMGKKDVVLLEQTKLTEGVTWHAPALIGQLRSSETYTKMLRRSVAVYTGLEADTGLSPGFRQVGSIRIATSQDRWLDIKRLASAARWLGFDAPLLTPEEVIERFPFAVPDGILGGIYVEGDGSIEAGPLALALAKGARQRGVTIREGVRVTGMVRKGRRVTGLETSEGPLRAETVVICGGNWARELGLMAGIDIPALGVEHQYIYTDPVPGVDRDYPVFREPDCSYYLQIGRNGIMAGAPDGHAKVHTPAAYEARLLFDTDDDKLERLAEAAARRVPVLNELGIREVVHGAIPASADDEPVIGLAPECDNVFVAAGFTAGIASAGGAGEILAEWIIEGESPIEISKFDIRRFSRHHNALHFLKERLPEVHGDYYLRHPLGEEARTARGIRKSPLYHRLDAAGAVFQSKAGWERPAWFAAAGEERVERPDFVAPNWDAAVAAEHKAIREGVALLDQSSFTKLEIFGPDALALMQRVCTADVDVPVGRIVYTMMCDRHGGIVSDPTIVRLAEDRFYFVAGSAALTHDRAWLEAHRQDGEVVFVEDVSSARAVINVSGPASRSLLQPVSEASLANEDFAFSTMQEIRVGAATVRAMRVTFTGELGWELHVPSEFADHLYDVLWNAGQPHGVVNAGYRAIDTLRLERGFRAMGADLAADVTPYEAGLGFTVARDKGDFVGREALLKAREAGPRHVLAMFSAPLETRFFGREAIRHGDEIVGRTTSAGLGHHVGRSIAYGFIKPELAKAEDGFLIEAFGEPVAVARHRKPLYDAERKRILGAPAPDSVEPATAAE